MEEARKAEGEMEEPQRVVHQHAMNEATAGHGGYSRGEVADAAMPTEAMKRKNLGQCNGSAEDHEQEKLEERKKWQQEVQG